MGRHGYSDDWDDEQQLDLGRWRGQVASATRGKRGQAFFRALVEALDAMPDKKLVAEELETKDGAVCALGCLGKARGVDMHGVDTENHAALGKLFDIAPQLAAEVMYVNDECHGGWPVNTTPDERWRIVRDWAAKQIRVEPAELSPQTPRGGGGK